MTEPLFDSAFNTGGDTYIALGYDAPFHISRIESIAYSLQAGEFPVYMYSYQSNGYCYPLGIMYPDLFLYPFALLRLYGLSLARCSKLFIVFTCFITILLSYISANMITKRKTLCICFSVVYSLAPYHLANVYGRYAAGECLATAFFPIVIASLYCMFYNKTSTKNWIWFSLGVAGIVYSHLLSLVMLAIICVICTITFAAATKSIPFKELALAFFSSLLMSLGFLVPFIDFYFSYEFLQKTWDWIPQFLAHPASLYNANELLSFLPNNDYSEGRVPLCIGWLFILVIALWPFIFIWLKINRYKNKSLSISAPCWCFWVLSIIFIIMAWNRFPWENFLSHQNFIFILKFFSKFQFASRFLNFAIIFLSFLFLFEASLIIDWSERHFKTKFLRSWFKYFFCALIVTLMFIPNFVYNKSLADSDVHANDSNTYFVDLLYTPENFAMDSELTKAFSNNPKDADSSNDNNIHRNGSKLIYNVVNPEKSGRWIDLPIIAYPHMKAINESGNPIDISATEKSIVKIYIPPEFTGEIIVAFNPPLFYFLSKVLSLLILTILIVVSFRKT